MRANIVRRSEEARKDVHMCEIRNEKRRRNYDGSRSPQTRRWRCAWVAPSRATEVIHATIIKASAERMRKVARHCQETGPLDVKVTWYQRSYQPRFNHRRSWASASAYIVESDRNKPVSKQKEEKKGGTRVCLLQHPRTYEPSDDPSHT